MSVRFRAARDGRPLCCIVAARPVSIAIAKSVVT